MSSSDLTKKLPSDQNSHLLEQMAALRTEVGELSKHFEIGFNSMEQRFDSMEQRFDKLSREIADGLSRINDTIEVLNRDKLNSDTDYISLRRRVGELERKVS